jgi:hypothetical protein
MARESALLLVEAAAVAVPIVARAIAECDGTEPRQHCRRGCGVVPEESWYHHSTQQLDLHGSMMMTIGTRDHSESWLRDGDSCDAVESAR